MSAGVGVGVCYSRARACDQAFSEVPQARITATEDLSKFSDEQTGLIDPSIDEKKRRAARVPNYSPKTVRVPNCSPNAQLQPQDGAIAVLRPGVVGGWASGDEGGCGVRYFRR